VLILVSGAFMVWAGYAFAEGRIRFGLWITTPPGFTIEAAFLIIRRHDRHSRRSAPSLLARLGQEGIILLAGGVMVLAGYAGADWNWLVSSPLVLLGLPIIAVAVWLGRRISGSPVVGVPKPVRTAGAEMSEAVSEPKVCDATLVPAALTAGTNTLPAWRPNSISVIETRRNE
jgi:hypothetical protein